MKKIAIFAMLLASAGCGETPEQKVTRRAENQRVCSNYGAVPGTPAYIQCMMGLDEQYNDEVRRKNRAMGAALATAGQGMSDMSTRNQMPTPIHCTSTQRGPFTNTNCY
ncbi:hypothetical protein ACEUZ9_001090 [Paracoccus litorisediminis]|uniref:hypothetical protein n=1 Tax=Paracoccus litorisediminis TaxID=2006130 RepID=UPI0037327BCD